MKSLIVGMGIGQLYKNVLSNLKHDIVTVDMDPQKGADYTNIEDAIRKHTYFQTVHICTPNFTHKELAETVAPYSHTIFVEKPGFKSSKDWLDFINHRPLTNLLMVKNNQYRNNLTDMIRLKDQAETIEIRWHNKDRVPNPGTWFTTRDLAFGGVSRDLMPHLLSLFQAIEPSYKTAELKNSESKRNWSLNDVKNTDYGVVNPNGTYDVDDYCRLEYLSNNKKWILEANWRTLTKDDRSIIFTMPDNSQKVIELGLCPEDAYSTMITNAKLSSTERAFWKKQIEQDVWIHQVIETL